MIDTTIQKLVGKFKTNCPFTLADRLNVMIEYLPLPPGTRGYYLYVRRRRFIGISNNITEEMQRFVCAHELGHDRLHKGIGHYFIEQNTLYNPGKFERQANLFAVKLLLGDSIIEEGETVETFCARNGVPGEMVHYLAYL